MISPPSFSKLLDVIDKDSDGIFSKDELKDHIKFMQKRYVMKDIDRTWGHYEKEKFVDGKLPWAEYRRAVYGPEGTWVAALSGYH